MFEYLINGTKGANDVVWSTHCHNDLGLATANTLEGIRGGARQVEVTVNGIGERAGNTAIEEIAMALKTRPLMYEGVYTDLDVSGITRASRMVSAFTGIMVQPNKAIVGANAFAHEAGIHQDGVLKNKETYEIMTPESVGLVANNLVLGKHSGKAAYADRLRALGYGDLSPEQLEGLGKCVVVSLCRCVVVSLCRCVVVSLCRCVVVSLCPCAHVPMCPCAHVPMCRCVVVSMYVVYFFGTDVVFDFFLIVCDLLVDRFKRIADDKKTVTDEDMEAIVNDEVYNTKDTWKLVSVHVTAGDKVKPTATVTLVNAEGEEFSEASLGNGPVDAVFSVIQQITGPAGKLTEFTIQSVTSGIDSVGNVIVRIEPEGEFSEILTNPQTGEDFARQFSGQGADADIIVASARAYLGAINRKVDYFDRKEEMLERSLSRIDSI
jgi:hypothetical protein